MAQRKKALRRLEEIVARLERGEDGLDKMVEAFEEGTELVRLCNRRLDEIERRIEQLVRRNGRDEVEPLNITDDATHQPTDSSS